MGDVSSSVRCSACCTMSEKEKQLKKEYLSGAKKSRPSKKKKTHIQPPKRPSSITISPKTAQLLTTLKNIPTGTPIETDIAIKTVLASFSNAYKTLPEETCTNTEDNVSLHEIEVNTSASTDRVQRLSHILDSVELEAAVNAQYDDIDDDDDDEAGSSDAEITQQTPALTTAKTPKLYRDNTASEWDENDVYALHNDMSQQIVALTDVLSNNTRRGRSMDKDQPVSHLETPDKFKVAITGSSDDDDDEQRLFRDQSADQWDDDQMAKRNEEMRKEMVHLLKTQTERSTQED